MAIRLSRTDADVLTLTSADRASYLRARQLADSVGVPLEAAMAQFVEVKRMLGEVPLVHAAEYFLKRNPTQMAPQPVTRVIEEMLIAKKGDGLNGWAEVLQRFGDPEPQCGLPFGIRPRLFIHRRCGRLVETLPALQHDPNRPEDVLKVDADEDGVGGDDAADALRYLVATKARAVSQRKLRGL